MKRLTMLVLLLGVLGCSEERDDATQATVAPSIAPLVMCCDFTNRADCREVRAPLLEKRGWLLKHETCFDNGQCLTGCP